MWADIIYLQPIWLLILGHFASAANVDWKTITNSRGDRLPDFSFCGYHASDEDLPESTGTPLAVINPKTGDQTAEIQAALDAAGKAGGGIVQLGKGKFHISPGLQIPSDTVLQGSGIPYTTLVVEKMVVGVPVLSLGDSTAAKIVPKQESQITDQYVGIGSSTVTVKSADGLKTGQSVFVSRAVTADWVRYNGMADLVRDNEPQTWIGEGVLVQQPRQIKLISGNKVTFDVPLTDSLDKKYMKPYIAVYTPPSGSKEIGLEKMSISHTPTCSGLKLNNTDPCGSSAIVVSPWTTDSWIRRVNITGFNSFLDIQSNSSRITVQRLGLIRDADTDNGAGYPADITIKGTQVLVRDSGQYGLSTAKAFAVVTQSGTPGPNAVVRHVTQSSAQQLYPHARWAHGFLADDTDASVSFINRGTSGSGQGWSINAGVAWNVRGDVQIQSPPLGVAWGIGSTGKIVSPTNGTMIQSGSSFTPKSLFDAQLSARQGSKG